MKRERRGGTFAGLDSTCQEVDSKQFHVKWAAETMQIIEGVQDREVKIDVVASNLCRGSGK